MNRMERQQRNRLLRIEAGLRERVEREALRASLAQTAALAARRGEDVQTADGKVRMWSRDGLRSLYERDQLDASEYEAGLFFRACFETVGALTISSGAQLVGVGGLHDGGWRAWRIRSLADMEGLARSQREATTLWRIAGEGRALSALGRGGADYEMNCRALRKVLGAIATRFGM